VADYANVLVKVVVILGVINRVPAAKPKRFHDYLDQFI